MVLAALVVFNFIVPAPTRSGKHMGHVWMLPPRQPDARQRPQAFDFDRLGLRSLAWQASPGECGIQTRPYYVGQELSENLCTCSVDCSSTPYDVQIISDIIHIQY